MESNAWRAPWPIQGKHEHAGLQRASHRQRPAESPYNAMTKTSSLSLLRRASEHGGATVHFTIDGQPAAAQEGDTVLTALLLAGDHVCLTLASGAPRAGFCMMGACQDCWVDTRDRGRLRACSTLIEDGMALLRSVPGESA